MCRRQIARRRFATVRLAGAFAVAMAGLWILRGGFVTAAPAAVSAAETGVASSGAQAQGSRFLFADATPQSQVASLAAQHPAVVRSRLVSLNLDWLAERGGQAQVTADPAKLVELNLFPDVFLLARLDRLEVRSPTQYSWIGHISGVDDSHVFLVVEHGVLAGSITLPSPAYEVRYVGDGLHTIYQVTPGVYHSSDEEQVRVPSSDAPIHHVGASASGPDVPSDDGTIFDLMVVYTQFVRQELGGTDAVNALINLGVDQTNQAFANSGVIPRLRLVHTAEVNHSLNQGVSNDLRWLQNPGDGILDDVHPLRDAVGADLVNLLVTGVATGCGKAYLMGGGRGPSLDFAPYAFSVTSYRCISPDYWFGHHLGHNMGCQHGQGDGMADDLFDWLAPGVFAYSYAHFDGGDRLRARFRTLMTFHSCFGVTPCPQLLQFSTPLRSYLGRPIGTANNDNARSINDVRITVANFRLSAAPGAPTNLSASVGEFQVTGWRVTLLWRAPSTGAPPTTYVIEAGSQPAQSNVVNFRTRSTATSYTADNVPEAVYYVRVRAENAGGTSPPSNEVRLEVPPVCTLPVPRAPTGLSYEVNGHQVTLRWTAPPPPDEPTGYFVEVGSSPGRGDVAIVHWASNVTHFVGEAPPGPGRYYVRVRAHNRCDDIGPPSNEVVITIL